MRRVTRLLQNASTESTAMRLLQLSFFVSLSLTCLLLERRSLHAEAPPSAAASDEFAEIGLTPFWRASTLRESLFFIDSGERPRASLLFHPEMIVRVTSATREIVFEEGRDYHFDEQSQTFSLPKGSRIHFLNLEQLYPLMSSDAPKIAKRAGDTSRGIYFDNQAGYHELQVEVTYECMPGQWKGYVPKFAGDQLPLTMKKLRAGEPFHLMLCGDSISAGYNASKFTKAKPGCPAYGELVALALQKHFGSKVTFTNHAVSGWTTGRGLSHATEMKIGKQQPDLVIIAFGMNDVFAQNASAYQKNVQDLMAAIRADSPNAEFILVASMLGNAKWGMPMEQFPLHRDALRDLCGPGVVLADLTAVWQELLQHKSFYDLTGNGVNHPNDFGHGIYAQTITALLIDP